MMSKIPETTLRRAAATLASLDAQSLGSSEARPAEEYAFTASAVLEAVGVGELLKALQLMRSEGPSRFSEETWLTAERAIAKAEGRE